jgi:K+-sensing histidine kinase KdpD
VVIPGDRTLGLAETAARAFALALSHQLRSPLFACTASLDAWELQRSHSGADQKLSNRLRSQLNSISTGLTVPPSLAQKPETLREIIERVESNVGQSSIELLANDETMAKLMAWPQNIELSLMCIIDNAIRYSPEGTTIKVECTEVSEPAATQIRVYDEAPRIENPSMVCRAFYSTSGRMGLGLSLARSALTECGGELSFKEHERGNVVELLISSAL